MTTEVTKTLNQTSCYTISKLRKNIGDQNACFYWGGSFSKLRTTVQSFIWQKPQRFPHKEHQKKCLIRERVYRFEGEVK